MRIFLTGGTGYLGAHLLRRLIDDGHEVLAIVRPASLERAYQHPNISWISADLREHGIVADAASQSDAVIHTAAEHRGEMQDVERAATEAVIAGLAGSGKPFISTSATVVYGDTGHVPRNEAEPIFAPLPSRIWRAENDRRIAGLEPHGIRGVVLRPPTIHGSGGGVIYERMETARKTGSAAYVGDGQAVWSTVHLEDLIDLFMLTLSSEQASGVFNAASSDRISRKLLAQTIASALGPTVTPGSITPEAAAASMGEGAAMATINQVISSARARAELGWNPHRMGLAADILHGSYR